MTDGVFNSSLFNSDIFNTHAEAGLTISGSHATAYIYGERKYHPEILTPVEFTFRIKAKTHITLILNQLNYSKLRPIKINSEGLAVSLDKLKEVWVKALKKDSLHYMMESILLQSDKVHLLKILKEMFKK